MKPILLLIATCFLYGNAHSQFDQKLTITANAGFVNLTNIGFSAAAISENAQFSRSGPFVFRAMYEVEPKFNLGISVGFMNREFQFMTIRTDGNTTTEFNNYINSNSLKLSGSLSYNLIDKENYELYTLVNLGYQMTKWEVKYEDYQDKFEDAVKQLPINESLLPENPTINRIRVDLMIGNRFWINKNFGINAELGLNSLAIIQAGLILRL